MGRTVHTVLATVLATALAAGALGAVAVPASAERWSARDEARDVTQSRYLPDPPPCGTFRESPRPDDATSDLVGLGVRHDGGAVTLRATLRHLAALRGQRVGFDVETAGHSYGVDVGTRERGRTPGPTLFEYSEPGPVSECGSYGILGTGVPCDDLTVDRSWERDVVTVTVPRSCLGSPRWVRVGATVYRQVGRRLRSDAWGTPDEDASGHFADALGPRVRHTARSVTGRSVTG